MSEPAARARPRRPRVAGTDTSPLRGAPPRPAGGASAHETPPFLTPLSSTWTSEPLARIEPLEAMTVLEPTSSSELTDREAQFTPLSGAPASRPVSAPPAPEPSPPPADVASVAEGESASEEDLPAEAVAAAANETGTEGASEGSGAREAESDLASQGGAETAREGNGEDTEHAGGAEVLAEQEPQHEAPAPFPGIEPAPIARLGGLAPLALPNPRPMPAEKAKAIWMQTGIVADEHHDRLRDRLRSLAYRTQRLQIDVVREVESVADGLRLRFELRADEIAQKTRQAVGAVRAAHNAARNEIREAATLAMGQIAHNATTAESTVDEQALTSADAINSEIARSSQRVRDLHTTEMARVQELLEEKKRQYRERSLEHKRYVTGRGPALAQSFDQMTGPDDVATAQNEQRGKAARRLARERGQAFEQDGTLRGDSLLSADNLAQFSLQFLALVNPAAVHIEQVGGEDEATMTCTAERTIIRLATRSERGQRTIELGRDQILFQLDHSERQAVAQISRAGRQIEQMARDQALALSEGIRGARAPYADSYRSYLERVHKGFGRGDFYDVRKYGPALERARRGLEDLDKNQRRTLDERADEGEKELEKELEKAIDGLNQSVSQVARSVDQSKATFLATIYRTELAFSDGLIGAATGMQSEADTYTTEVEEKLGLQNERVVEEMTALIDRSRTAIDAQITTWDTEAVAAADRFGQEGDPGSLGFQQVALTLFETLRTQVSELHNAAEEFSLSEGATDEARMMRALQGLTLKRGNALKLLYSKEHGDLVAMLEDELGSDSEHYLAAIDFLAGRTVSGTRHAIAASIHWYGDDEAAILEAQRALTARELAELRNQPEWAAVSERVGSALDGTDLQVFRALEQGNFERAAAIELGTTVDRARYREREDPVVDAVAGIAPPTRRYEDAAPDEAELDRFRRGVFREFADVHGLARGESITDDEAARRFVTWATRDVEITESAGEGGTYTRTSRMSEAGREAVRALAIEGPRSPIAVAARMNYEVTAHGRSDLGRLEAAAGNPELAAARADPRLTSPHPSLRAAAEERLARLEADRAAAFQRFAELQNQSADVVNDPARARDFTARRFEDLFGSDDELGREFARTLVLEGRPNRAVALRLAMRGAGTDEDLIKRTLSGMSHEEVQELRRDYARRFGGGDIDALDKDLGTNGHGGWFSGELSGRDRQDVEKLLAGEGRTDRDRARLARLDRRHQLDEAGDAVRNGPEFAHERERIRVQEAQLEAMIREAGGDPPFLPDGEPNPAAFNEDGSFKGDSLAFAQLSFGVSQSAADLKSAVERQEAFLVGVIQVVGAIAGIALTIATGGVAAPILVAALTGLMTIAVKQSLRGQAYGWEEALTDVGATVLDMATAAIGGSKVFRPVQMVDGQAVRLTGARLVVRAGMRGLTTGFVGGAGHTALNDRTWDRGLAAGLGAMFTHGLRGGVQSAITSMATAGIGDRLRSGLEGERGSGALGRLGARAGEVGRQSIENALSSSAGAMIGETAGILIDTAGGEYRGNLLTALGQIGVAGGRELLQGAGEGAAGVLHAYGQARRRDPNLTLRAYLAQRNDEIALQRAAVDAGRAGANEPPPRIAPPPPSGDILADRGTPAERLAAFRRAKAVEPELDLETFLRRRDEAILSSRADAEQARARQRELRSELLSGIPPEQRRHFARVSISELDDAMFTSVTGSQSARAVTIFIDGQPHVILRRSASVEALREEGLHLVQSRDPGWRNRVAELDESRLARWRELPLDEQLALYRTKVEIELDAQQRLAAGLRGELEQASTPAARAALERRIGEAEVAEQSLRARLAEVDSITPERARAIADGREARPQYLNEPPRLFSKTAPPTVTRERSEEPDESAPRRLLADPRSTFAKEGHPNARLYQVGDEAIDDGRRYRVVELIDDGVTVGRREEILMPNGTWIESGTSKNARGGRFEEAARLATIERARAPVTSGDIDAEAARVDVARAPLVPISALRDLNGRPISARHGTAGFDDVYLRFRSDGTAQIVLVESKSRSSHPRYSELGAITKNFGRNMARVEAALRAADIPEPRRSQVREALARWDVALEVQHAQGTPIAADGRVLTTVQEVARTWRRLRVLAGAVPTSSDAPRFGARVNDLQEDLRERLKDVTNHETAQEIVTTFESRVRALAREMGVTLPVSPGAARADRPGWELELLQPQPVDPRFETLRAQYHAETGTIATRPVAFSLEATRSTGLTSGGEQLVRAETPHHSRTSRVVRDDQGNHVVITSPTPQVLALTTRTVPSLLFQQLTYSMSVDGRLVEPRYVVWDSTPFGIVELGRQVRALLPWMRGYPDELSRLRLMIPAERVGSETMLRALFGYPPGMTLRRAGNQVVVSFERPPLALLESHDARPSAPGAPPPSDSGTPRRPAPSPDDPNTPADPSRSAAETSSAPHPPAPPAEPLPRNVATPDPVRNPLPDLDAGSPRRPLELERTPAHEAGLDPGARIRSEAVAPDGHKVRALEDGRITRCSTCGELRAHYDQFLRQNLPGTPQGAVNPHPARALLDAELTALERRSKELAEESRRLDEREAAGEDVRAEREAVQRSRDALTEEVIDLDRRLRALAAEHLGIEFGVQDPNQSQAMEQLLRVLTPEELRTLMGHVGAAHLRTLADAGDELLLEAKNVLRPEVGAERSALLEFVVRAKLKPAQYDRLRQLDVSAPAVAHAARATLLIPEPYGNAVRNAVRQLLNQAATANAKNLPAFRAAAEELERLAELYGRALNTAAVSTKLTQVLQRNEKTPQRIVTALSALEREIVLAGVPNTAGLLYTAEKDLTSGGIHGVGWPENEARRRSVTSKHAGGKDQGAFVTFAEVHFVIEWAARNLNPGEQALIPAADLPPWFQGIVYPKNGDPARSVTSGSNPGVYVAVDWRGVIHAYPGNNLVLGA